MTWVKYAEGIREMHTENIKVKYHVLQTDVDEKMVSNGSWRNRA
jgi:hypothetical protein